jgi:hypothetical protein
MHYYKAKCLWAQAIIFQGRRVVFIVLLNIATGLKIATNTVPCFVKESDENRTFASCVHCEKHRLLVILVAHAENTATGSVQRTFHGCVCLPHRNT